MAQFVLKIEKLSHIMGPVREHPKTYGLRPRLWLLVQRNTTMNQWKLKASTRNWCKQGKSGVNKSQPVLVELVCLLFGFFFHLWNGANQNRIILNCRWHSVANRFCLPSKRSTKQILNNLQGLLRLRKTEVHCNTHRWRKLFHWKSFSWTRRPSCYSMLSWWAWNSNNSSLMVVL